MKKAASELDFERATELRDILFEMRIQQCKNYDKFSKNSLLINNKIRIKQQNLLNVS